MGIPRDFVKHSDAKENPNGSGSLRLMTFNVLAHGLSSNSFIKCPAEALQLERRLNGIVGEISSYSADLICLQEVDMYDQLKTRLSDYGSVWHAKNSSPCLYASDNIGPDGSAIFYKTSTVKLLSQHAMPLQADGVDTNQLLLALQLQLSTGHRLLLVCLHLKAKSPFSELRLQQGTFVLDFIKSNQAGCDSVIIAGDLNSVPEEPVHKLLESSGFISSHVAVTGRHPEYTTCKIRSVKGADEKQCKVEDYIYHKDLPSNSELKIQKVLEVPAESALGEGRLPSMDYPSDHLSMVADYLIT